jgi:hypothetical protein
VDDLAPAKQNRTVLRLPTRDEIVRQTAREIGVQFPGWHVWHSSRSGTWNAHREGEEPFFGRPASGRRFMVAAYDKVSLVVLLEAQVRLDIEVEFPGWQVGQTATGRWYAINRDRIGCGSEALTRVIRCPAVSDLHTALRDLSHGEQPPGNYSAADDDGHECSVEQAAVAAALLTHNYHGEA